MATGTMTFIDGENLTIRGQVIARTAGVSLARGPHHRTDTFLWMSGVAASDLPSVMRADRMIETPVRRSYYFTSVRGEHDLVTAVREELWRLEFTPRVFKREGTRPSKRVDIALATEALSNAHLGNYSSAIILAGDEDYVPLVEEIKRTGKVVAVVFFDGEGSGMSKELRLAADRFYPLNELFLDRWQVSEPARLAEPI